MTLPPHETVSQMFIERVALAPTAEAFQAPTSSGWRSYTWKEVGEQVRQVSMGLRALGLKDEQRCSILCGTRYEWIVADLGIMCAGGATTTIYPSSTADEAAYIISDSDTAFVIAENAEQVQKLVQVRAKIPSVQKVIVIDGDGGHGGWVLSMAELTSQGKQRNDADPAEFVRIARSVKKDALATLIYTSGTTGQPKGVELTHDTWVFEGQAIDSMGALTANDRQYLWLPLAHAFGKVLTVAQLRIGFPTAVDGRIEKMVENLAVIRPTFVCGVPRIFEKVHNKVVANAREAGGLKAKIFDWALGVGREASALRQQGREAGPILAVKHAVANKLVFSKVQNRFGGNLRFFISGSAALSKEMATFFHAVGILILEGYGLTESAAASFVNRPSQYKFGTVGPPLAGVEMKIAEDGEIFIRGRGIMRGYHNLPEATAEALTDDRWLRTGDIGELDAQGFLKITDRKKDLIKTSGGKYVAPQFLEGKLKALCPYASQVVIHGDNRKYISALIAVDPEAITKWANENGLGGKSYQEITQDKRTHALIQGYVEQMNKELPSYETVKQFAILPADLSIESGELTPSMKVRRKVVEKKYMNILDGFYEDGRSRAAGA